MSPEGFVVWLFNQTEMYFIIAGAVCIGWWLANKWSQL